MMFDPDSDPAAQQIKRLLALKRHEQPPPQFFERLPSRVLMNIRAGAEMDEGPWWSRLWEAVVREPMVAGSYAALGVGALLFGISVFQMAADHGTPVFAGVEGMADTSPSMSVVPSDNLPQGVIYRVPAAAIAGAPVDTVFGAPYFNANFRGDSLNGVEVSRTRSDW